MKYVDSLDDFILKELLTESKKHDFEVSDEYCFLDTMLKGFDLSKIPEDEIKKSYVNYKVFHLESFGTILSGYRRDEILMEGVNKSEDIGTVRKEIISKYGINDWQFRVDDGKNEIKVAIIAPNIHDNINMLIEDMYILGYYTCYIEPLEYKNYNFVAIRFDPIYTKDITNVVRNMKYIRHWTPKYNEDEIIKNGFVPKSENSRFNYPTRIHFLKSGIDDSNLFGCVLELNKYNNDKRNDGRYVLFTIDTSLLPDNVRFFGDSCYEFGICTYDQVPFDCVIKSEEYNVNKK